MFNLVSIDKSIKQYILPKAEAIVDEGDPTETEFIGYMNEVTKFNIVYFFLFFFLKEKKKKKKPNNIY